MLKPHPELKDGEIFLSNIPYCSNYLSICGFNSVRVGTQAYAYNGSKLPESLGYLPVFVSKEEYELSIRRTDADESYTN